MADQIDFAIHRGEGREPHRQAGFRGRLGDGGLVLVDEDAAQSFIGYSQAVRYWSRE